MGEYYYIVNPDGPGFCWVWGEYLTKIGNMTLAPVFTRMPTYTPTPAISFIYVFNEVLQCVTMYGIELFVTNTGGLSLESFDLYAENTTTHNFGTYSDTKFADCEACGCGVIDYTITAGENGWLGSGILFMDHYPHGESFHTELTMCTQDSLGGDCLTQILDFTVP